MMGKDRVKDQGKNKAGATVSTAAGTTAAVLAGGMVAAPAIDIGIADKARARIVDGLSRVLADSYTLYLQTHNFHWNVEGPMFNTLHVMFMQQYTELWTALDAIAERIRSLGYPAPGTYREFARLSSIKEIDGVPAALDMVRLLVAGHEAVTRTLRAAFPAAEKGGDEATVDLLTQRLQVHEKTAWMLRSLLE
jgi:starvation-inducible DNA-binding protein